jgi:hypothetical protein
MELMKCNREDCVPLALHVLKITLDNYLCNVFKFLIQESYPDLKGVVPTDCLDESSFELLETISTEPLTIVLQSLEAIKETCDSIINIYGIDSDKVFEDERLFVLAKEFYFSIIINNFPLDGRGDSSTMSDYENYLILYAVSTVGVVNLLCKLLADSEVDFEYAWGDESLDVEFLYTDYSQRENSVAIRLLQQLGYTLNDHEAEIVFSH